MDNTKHYRYGYLVIIALIGFVIFSTIIHIDSRRQIEDTRNQMRHGFEGRGFDITDEKWEIYLNSNPDKKLKIYNDWRREANEIP